MLYFIIVLTGQMLQSINVPTHVFYESVNCESSIECFYSNIVNALDTAGVASVPTILQNALKPFWNADLDELKRQSVADHKLWKSLGKPWTGPINTARLKIKAEYKCAVWRAAVEFENSHLDESAEYFAHRYMNNFWRSWNIKYSKHVRVDDICIDGNTSADKIADSFRQFYASIYVNSAEDKCKVDEFNKHRLHYVGDTNDISITVENIEQAVNELSVKKAAGIDGITSEHILYSHPCVIVYLKLLFHMMLLHGYVPHNFGLGVIVPKLKDNKKAQLSLTNPRDACEKFARFT